MVQNHSGQEHPPGMMPGMMPLPAAPHSLQTPHLACHRGVTQPAWQLPPPVGSRCHGHSSGCPCRSPRGVSIPWPPAGWAEVGQPAEGWDPGKTTGWLGRTSGWGWQGKGDVARQLGGYRRPLVRGDYRQTWTRSKRPNVLQPGRKAGFSVCFPKKRGCG